MYELPLFPLNVVLFPGMPLRLQVFEERYQIMMQRVLQTNYTFGVSLIKSGVEANGPLPEPYLTGCTARVVQADPLPDGRLNVTVVGDERFRVLMLGSTGAYLNAFVENIPLQRQETEGVAQRVRVLRKKMIRYLTLLSKYVQQEQAGDEGMEGSPGGDETVEARLNLSELHMPEDPMMLTYLAAALLQLPPSEKQPILEVDTLTQLLEMVQRIYRRELAVLPQLMQVSDEEARLFAWMN